MNLRNLVFVLALTIPLTITTVGCSRGASPMDASPVVPEQGTYDSMPAISDAGQSGMGSERQLQGIWVADCNPENLTPGSAGVSPANITPIRTADFHLNVRPFIAPPVIYIKSWNPTTKVIDLDVTIHNTSSYNGYDTRLIIFNDTIGHKLLNPDNYTHLWDIPEGSWSNGFKSYAKENANRILHAGELKVENIQILCPNGNFNVQFAIDASWPTNCAEPYMINNFTQGMLQAYEGATSDITVDVYDWQSNVESVRIQASAITGETDTYMTQIDSETWDVELVNNNGVPEGDYFALIAALSQGSSDPLIHLVTITVSPAVGGGYALTWGGNGTDRGRGITVDDDGNIYSTGKFYSTVDFNPDLIEEEFRTGVNGYETGFLSKFDSHGDFQWVRTFGEEGGVTIGSSVDTNTDGEVYVVGSSANYLGSAFLMKFNADGEILWQGGWSTSPLTEGNCVKVRNDGSVVVSGCFYGTTDFDPSTGTDIHTSSDIDAFVNVFDSSCNQLWSAVWGGTSVDKTENSDIDSDGNIFNVGYFWGNTDLDPGDGTYLLTGTLTDCFISKLDNNGNFLWGHAWGGPSWDSAEDCAVDEFGDVYTVGTFYYTVDFDPDPVDVAEKTAIWEDDVFTSKFDSDGDFKYVHTWGSGGMEQGRTITCSGNGRYWVGGHTDGDLIDFDPGVGENYLRQLNLFVSCFSLDGSYLWTSGWKYSRLWSIYSSSDNSIFIIGAYSASWTDFDPGPEEWEPQNYQNADDIYINKLLPNGLWD